MVPKRSFPLALLACLLLSPAFGQASGQRWTATWIAHPDDPGDEFGVWNFRRSFELEAVPDSFLVRVSADNRYRLFVNGIAVSEGPARGDLMHWRYETVDLSPHLEPGSNILAAVVWNFAEHRPQAQFTLRTGFLLQGPPGASVDSGSEWRVARNGAYTPMPVTRDMVGGAYIVVGPGEEVDGAAYPWGWTASDFDDSAWPAARPFRDAVEHLGPNYGAYTGWKLVPRSIPVMEHTPQRFDSVVRSAGTSARPGFVTGEDPVVVEPHGTASILLDQGILTTAYPELRVNGGAGSRISVTYAEALVDEAGEKHHRDRSDGMHIRGYADRFLPDGGANRLFRPLWWRTFRYVQLDVETGDEPLTIEDFSSEFTAYPFVERGRFAGSDPDLGAIWSAGWRTARLCAGETYFDCPYYEQLQYVGDTRIQALVSLYVSGDDRLMRKAIELFDDSRIPEGLTQSRYPAHGTQFIPPYSLLWIAMVHDYWMLRDDARFVEQRLTGIRGIVDWYARLVDETGMVGPSPWWSFVDWSFPGGIPPGATDGHSTIVTLQYAYVLGYAEELAGAFGREEAARHYRELADRLNRSAMNQAWDTDRGLMADTPERRSFSQHASILAVLSGAVPEEWQRGVVQRVLDDSSLTQATFYFRFYLHRAMQQVGLADRYVEELQPWREMLALGLSTFAEEPEPTRSDAHAWSASPNYFLLSLVCGIRPDAPGFRSVLIAPAPGDLDRIEGSVPHPLGTVSLKMERLPSGEYQADVILPDNVTGRFIWRGSVRNLAGGSSSIRLER